MRVFRKSVVVALTLAIIATPVAASARLEGLLLDVDGRAASGYKVHLIDSGGRDFVQTSASADGVYAFRELPAGEYALGIESPDGLMAPVAAPPVRLARNELARRDIKLMQADAAERDALTSSAEGGFGLFWAGLSPWMKTWSIVGVLVFLGVTIKALDTESSASPVTSN